MGNFEFHGKPVIARKFDGSDESKTALMSWINSDHGPSTATEEYEKDYFTISDSLKRIIYKVRPNSWVVRTSQGIFLAVYPDIFSKYYKKIHDLEGVS